MKYYTMNFNMLAFSLVLLAISALTSCNSNLSGKVFGEDFEENNPVAATELDQTSEDEERVSVQVVGEVDKVCKMEGCWMKFKGSDIYINVVDDAFKLPTSLVGKTVVVNGEIDREEELTVEVTGVKVK